MAKIDSSKVFVFPSSERGTTTPDARIFYEKNTTNLINQLLGKDSFVITPKFNKDNPFRFNVKGYYFEISTGQTIIDSATGSGSNIYAAIKIVVNNDMPELQGNDEGEKYTGVDIVRSDTVPTNLDVTYLQLLKLVGTNWVIPDESRIQFIKQNGTTISNSNFINPTINGGTLTQSDITDGTIVRSTIENVYISTVDNQFKTQIGSAELNTDGSIDHANLNNATISGGNIANANISDSTISSGTISGSTLQNITITATSGDTNYLSSCVMQGSEIYNTSIFGSTLDGIDGGEIA